MTSTTPTRNRGHNRMAPLALSLALGGLCSCSSLEQEAQEDIWDPRKYRPTELEQLRVGTPYTLDQGEWEFVIVSSFLDFGADERSGVQAEIEFGLLDNLVFETKIPAQWVHSNGETTGGIADVNVELKLQLSEQEDLGAATALGVEVSIPTGDDDRDLGSGEVGWEILGSAARNFGNVSLFGEFAAKLQEGSRGEYKFDGAIDWAPWSNHTRLQLGVNYDFALGEGPALSLVPGLQFEAGELPFGDLEVGVGFPVGLNHAAQDWGAILCLELEF